MVAIDINIVDSRDDSNLAYIVVGNCRVPVLKSKIKIDNMCYILKLIGDTCHIDVQDDECQKAKTK